MRKIIPYLLLFSLLAFSCDKNPTPGPGKNNQTVFIYLPWSGNLTSDFRTNIQDFEKALQNDILKNERVLVFFMTSSTEGTLYELTYENGQNLRTTHKTYTSPAFTTAAWITSILNDVKSLAPASRYGMVIGGHGMGWLPAGTTRARMVDGEREKEYWEYGEQEGVSLTRYFGGTSAEHQTEVTTLAQGIRDAGMKMEYILFDNCYMSTAEVAYDLRDAADYLIVSPTESMAYGVPYQMVAPSLLGQVSYLGATTAYHTFYSTTNLTRRCGTIAVVRCAEMENLAAVMKKINQQFTFNVAQLNALQRMDGYSPVRFFDLGHYVELLCSDAQLFAEFKVQFDRTVPLAWRKHTPTFYTGAMGEVSIHKFSGMTISDPSVSTLCVTKTETAWYQATH